MKLTKLDNLCTEYQIWCDSNGFPQLSADELLLEVELTDEQKSYVENFLKCWDASVSPL